MGFRREKDFTAVLSVKVYSAREKMPKDNSDIVLLNFEDGSLQCVHGHLQNGIHEAFVEYMKKNGFTHWRYEADCDNVLRILKEMKNEIK